MHILLVLSWYKTPEKPINGTFFEEHARMLQKKGYKVGVLCPTFDGRFSLKTAFSQFFKNSQPNDFIDKGIPTMYSHSTALFPSRFQKMNFWFANFMTYWKYKKYAKQYGKPDFIHAFSVFIAGWSARYISKKENINYVFTENTNSIINSKWITTDKVTREVIKQTFSEAKAVQIKSSFFKQQLIDIHNISPDNVTIIPNFVNPIFYETFIRKEKSSPFILSYIASIDKRKQQDLLLEALVILSVRGYDVKLNLIGDGSEKKALIEYTKEKMIQHLVIFMGNQSRETVKQEMDKSHLILSASKLETFGLSVIEAFACGRPVVAIDSGGPRDTINSGNGILVKENSAEKFAEAIISIINNYENYDQEKIRTGCYNKYTEDSVFKMFDPIYREAATTK